MNICYFGIYNPEFGRNKIYIESLKSRGHTIVECRDTSAGFRKFINLWRAHKKIKGSYDVLIVGYPGHIVVPFARLLSHKKVIVDALGSLFDAEVHSHYPSIYKRIKSYLIDWCMVICAHKILLETKAQKKYFEHNFGFTHKYEVVYTGADSKFEHARKHEYDDGVFQVLFRGKLTPESGIRYILEAAKLLKEYTHITFKIIGIGYALDMATAYIATEKLHNVELISKFLSDEELIQEMQTADIMLGQFEDNPRLSRTIPHKAFESFALGIPYITGEASAIKEIISNNHAISLVPLAQAEALADALRDLSQKRDLLEEAGEDAHQMYQTRFSSQVLGKQLEVLINSLVS